MQQRFLMRKRPGAARRAAIALGASVALGVGCSVHPLTGGAMPSVGQLNPFAGASLFVEPESPAWRQVGEWRTTRPADARYLERIAGSPTAIWFGDWNRDIRAEARHAVERIRARGALPVLVAYNIPQRDCGSYSAGGANSDAAYRRWIRDFGAGIDRAGAVVILEPDALAGMDCLSTRGQDQRVALLRDAVSVLRAHGAAVYIDAGHGRWVGADEMAHRLRRVGIEQASGFSLNVSNFHGTAVNIAYGEQLSARTGGMRFVIDTSRNGVGTASPGDWCNPADQALGEFPTASTGHPLVDAFLWIKRPGESDGTCGGGPPAGQWWADYALGLAQRQPAVLAAAR
jgi:endoglucanase